MLLNYFKTVSWSTPYDPEWITDSPTSTVQIGYPGEFTIDSDGGNITAMGFLKDYFYVNLQRATFVYMFTGARTPLQDVGRVNYGCAFDRHLDVVDKNGIEYLYWVAENGDIRVTNGPSYNECISDIVSPITTRMLGGRQIQQYYSGDGDAAPASYFDKHSKILRFFYAGATPTNNKMLAYNYMKGSWTTGDGPYCAAIASYGMDDAVAVLGTSDLSGETHKVSVDETDGSLKGFINLGWLPPSQPHTKLKVYNVTIWAHAEEGCDTEITVKAYNDKASPEAVRTEVRPLVYNESDENVQKLFYNLLVSGHAVKITIEDTGENANYAIDKIEVEAVNLSSPN
jgi:hypothetical protein